MGDQKGTLLLFNDTIDFYDSFMLCEFWEINLVL